MRVALALVGRTLTARQIGAELPDVAQATLYHHLGALTRGGALRVVEERRARGAVERVYALGDVAAALGQTPASPPTPEAMEPIYNAFIGALLAEGARYLRSPGADPAHDGFGFRQVPLYLSDDEFLRMVSALNAAVVPLLANTPGPGRRRRVFTTVLIPAPTTDTSASENASENAHKRAERSHDHADAAE